MKGVGKVYCRVKFWLLVASILPFRYSLKGIEKGVIQLGELVPCGVRVKGERAQGS